MSKAKTKRATKGGKVMTTKQARSKDAKRIKRIGNADHVVDLSKYVPVTSANGNSSLDNGDDVATKLRGKELGEVYTIVAKATDVSVKQLKANYGHLNVGMQRMNLGNKYRGALRASA